MTVTHTFGPSAPLTAGTNVTTSTAGTGDTPFSEVDPTPSIATIDGDLAIQIDNVADIEHVAYVVGTTGPWAVRAYVRFSAVPSATSSVIFAGPSGGGFLWVVGVTSGGQFVLRNSSNSGVATSGAIQANTWYRVEVRGAADGGSQVTIAIYNLDGSPFWASAARTVGSNARPYRTIFGRQSSTQYGATLYLRDIARADVNAEIGPVEGPPPPVDPVPVRDWSGTGIANGTPVTTALADGDDDPFDAVGGTPTVLDGMIRIPNTSTISFVRWTKLGTDGAWALRLYVRLDGPATGTSPLVTARDEDGTLLWIFGLGSANQFQLRNRSNSAVAFSGSIITPGMYRVELRGAADSSNVTATIWTDTGATWWGPRTEAVGGLARPDDVQIGRQSSTQYGTEVRVGWLATRDTNAVIGADPLAPLPPPPPPTFHWWVKKPGGTLVPVTPGAVKRDGDVVPIGGTAEQYTPPPSTRTAFTHPFASGSVWNTSVGSGALYEASTDARTARFLTGTPQVNRDRWSFVPALASASDPLVTLQVLESRGGPVVRTEQIRCPADVQPTAGSDAHVGIVQPDGYTVYELYAFTRVNATTIASHYVNVNDLRGSGLTRGSQASAISFMGGLIRAHDLATGYIDHALKIGAPASMLKPTPTSDDGAVSTISGVAEAVWPARRQDRQIGSNIYTGIIAMGSLFAIPTSVDLNALGLTPEGLILGRALQNYGAYILIQASTIALYCEPSTSLAAFTRLRGDWQTKLFPRMRRIANNAPGALNANRNPIDPSGVAGGGTRRRPTVPAIPGEFL